MISELESSTIKVILFNVILGCTFHKQLYFIMWEHIVTQATKFLQGLGYQMDQYPMSVWATLLLKMQT
jgi:hypothetical protein